MARLFIRVCAVLIVFRAFTNFAKLFQGDDAVLVFFGQILHGSDVAIPAALVGLFMLAAGISMWIGGRSAFPLAATYATYVAINLIAWTVTNPGEFERVGAMVSSAATPEELRRNGMLAFVGYCIVAIGTTAGPAWVLWKKRGSEPAH